MTPVTFHVLLICIVVSMTMLMGTTMIALALLLKQKKSASGKKRTNNHRYPTTTATTAQMQQQQHTYNRTISTEMIRDRYAPSGTSPRTAADAHLSQALQYTTSLPPFLNNNQLSLFLLPFDHDMEREYIHFQKWRKHHSTTTTARNKPKKKNQKTNSIFFAYLARIRVLATTFNQFITSTTEFANTLISSVFSRDTSRNNQKKAKSTSNKLKPRRSTKNPFASKNDTDALWHLQRSADLGNPYAQYWMGNILASGIYSSIVPSPSSTIQVTDDIGNGGSQLARAIIQWHFASIQGIQEAQMALGYRYFSAFEESPGGRKPPGDGGPNSFGVVGDCSIALAYYEEAANAAIDQMESSELKGKVTPASDRHRLTEIHMHGASSALAMYNKPDEHVEALEYLRIRATSSGDSASAFSLAQLHHYGHRGVEQNMAEALKYYELAANAASLANNNNPLSLDNNPLLTNHPEAAGWAAKFYLLGIGVDQPNYEKAWKYMQMGAPGGLKTCNHEDDRRVCDAESLNCFGLAYLRGLPGILEPDLKRAVRYFTLAKEYGSSDGAYHLAMMRLGWMNTEEDKSADDALSSTSTVDPKFVTDDARINAFINHLTAENSMTAGKGVPSKEDFAKSFNDFVRAGQDGHIQAIHKVGIMYARGIGVPRDCHKAILHFRQISEHSSSMGQRLRKAYKSYREGRVDVALWNYLVAAEAGIELAQSNAAWLMERGHCLGLDEFACANASVRMWKAASRQGNSEANIRVGDFHYYGRLLRHQNGESESTATFDWPFVITYLTQPKQMLRLLKSKSFIAVRMLLGKINHFGWLRKKSNAATSLDPFNDQNKLPHSCEASDMTCKTTAPKKAKASKSVSRETNFKLAAQYYRRAAGYNSGRANFNLGFMYEWGLGLNQDFPLAKRHYDLAATHHREAELAVSIALWFMHIHQWCVSIKNQWKGHPSLSSLAVSWVEHTLLSSDLNSLSESDLRRREILISHLFSLDTAIVMLLTLLMIMLLKRYLTSWK